MISTTIMSFNELFLLLFHCLKKNRNANGRMSSGLGINNLQLLWLLYTNSKHISNPINVLKCLITIKGVPTTLHSKLSSTILLSTLLRLILWSNYFTFEFRHIKNNFFFNIKVWFPLIVMSVVFSWISIKVNSFRIMNWDFLNFLCFNSLTSLNNVL